jgi:hypothetical protein
MIPDRIVVQAVSGSAISHTQRRPLGADPVSVLTALIPHVTSAVARLTKMPPLGYANLWEASVLVALIHGADRVDSDSVASRTSVPVGDGFWSRF